MRAGAGTNVRIEQVLSRGLSAWVRAVERRWRSVVVAFIGVTLALAVYTALTLGFNTSHTALLSDDLPFYRQYMEFAEALPIVDEAIFVVIDAESPTQAREATADLASRLEARTDLFSSVYVPGGGEFFERHGLLYLSVEELDDLADHLATVQPLLAQLARDRSLPGLVSMLDEGIALGRGDPTISENLAAVFDSVSLAAQAVLEGHPRAVSWTELLLERSLPGDSSRRLIIVSSNLDYSRLLPAREAIGAIRDAAAELELDDDHGVSVRVTGNVALNYEEMMGIARQALYGIGISFVLVGFIVTLALGSRRIVFPVLMTLLVGLIWTAAFAAFAVGRLNVLSVAFAILFIGLGIDFGIHIGMRYGELCRGGMDHGDALVETTSSVGGSLVLCAITTAIGFYVFIPTDFRAVAQLGLISGTGMPISLFCSLTLIPALLTGSRGAPMGRKPPRAVTRSLVPLAVRHARAVLVVAALLGAAALFALPSVSFDFNVARMRDITTESAATFEELLADSDNSPWTIDVLAADLDSADRVAAQLAALDEVERAITLTDYIPEEQAEKRAILADLAMFVPAPRPEAERPRPIVADQIDALRALRRMLREFWIEENDTGRNLSARRADRHLERLLARLETIDHKDEALADFEESLIGSLTDQLHSLWKALDPSDVGLAELPVDLAERMVAADGRARVQVLPREDINEREALERFVDSVRALQPTATGSAVSILEWGRATVRSFREALILAVVAVSLVVFLLWWRVADVLLVMAPLGLAAVLTGATASVLGIHFNFANVVVIPLLLGIGVDSGIHLVHRYRVMALTAAENVIEIEEDLLASSTAQAVFFSAVTTMASFGSLTLSTHLGIRSLGQLLLIGITWTVVCNLIVLPALIAVRSRVAVPAPGASGETASAG